MTFDRGRVPRISSDGAELLTLSELVEGFDRGRKFSKDEPVSVDSWDNIDDLCDLTPSMPTAPMLFRYYFHEADDWASSSPGPLHNMFHVMREFGDMLLTVTARQWVIEHPALVAQAGVLKLLAVAEPLAHALLHELRMDNDSVLGNPMQLFEEILRPSAEILARLTPDMQSTIDEAKKRHVIYQAMEPWRLTQRPAHMGYDEGTPATWDSIRSHLQGG